MQPQHAEGELITFVPLMRIYITLILFVLFFARCSEDDERRPKSAVGSRQSAVSSRQSAVSSQQSAVGSRKTEYGTRYTVHGTRHTVQGTRFTADRGLPTADRRPPTLDTTFIRRLRQQASSGQEIDLREPVSRAYLLSSVENPEFSSMILLSHDRSIRINFDNDILDNTDRYYTNGIRFDFISPYLRQSPLSWLMIPYWGKGINYYGVSIGQNMYTPFSTKVGGIHQGDRPYAAYLFIGGFKISNDPGKKFRQTSEIDLGVIGPSSFGDFVQKSFHNSVPTNNEPLGWEYQIQDDLVLNYNLAYEKGIFSNRRTDFNLDVTGALGTLYTNMAGGFQFRAGLMNPYFGSYGYSRMKVDKAQGYSKLQIFVFITSLGKLVGYDATLEGGMFNRSSIYTLTSSDLYRLTYQGTVGFTLSYAGVRLDVEQFLLSPEFHGCAWHKWVHIGVTFGM
jgi:hypothetical protein